jgi:hypothetical protein
MSEEREESSSMAAIANAVAALNLEAKRLYDAGKYEQAMQTAHPRDRNLDQIRNKVIAYRPRNFGGRFSAKARRPSA